MRMSARRASLISSISLLAGFILLFIAAVSAVFLAGQSDGFGQIDGTPTTLGVATGDLKGALGVQIVSASADFTTITVQHHWVTENGETLVVDQAQAHGVFVAPGLLAVTEFISAAVPADTPMPPPIRLSLAK